MNKRLTISVGLGLIFFGTMALASGLLGVLFDFRIWHLWPIIVILAGLGIVLPATLGKQGTKLGWLYILGLPTLTTGAILLVASVLRWWRIWATLWPLVVIGTALGFLLAALRARSRGLFVPALLIGANGLCLQFCAVTGWWRAWAVLWAVEPIAIGIAILILNSRRHSRRWQTVGLISCAIGALGFLEASSAVALASIAPLWLLWRWLTPITLILIGAGLLLWQMPRRIATSEL